MSNTFYYACIMGEVIELVDALMQILYNFLVATFQYGKEIVQTTTT